MKEFIKEKGNKQKSLMWQREKSRPVTLPAISEDKKPQPQAQLLRYLYSASHRWRAINNAA